MVVQKRKPIVVAANWKMNLGPSAAGDYLKDFIELVKKDTRLISSIDNKEVEVIFFPPSVSLPCVHSHLGTNYFMLGAQNAHWLPSGAYTGEISIPMLKEVGVTHVLVGHSERRWLFHETDEVISLKVKACFEFGVSPVLCVGEREEDRLDNKTEEVIEKQVRHGLSFLKDFNMKITDALYIAYEPVWAIGTGKTASPKDAQEAIGFIRELIGTIYGRNCADAVRILYGGSVNPENAEDLIMQEDINGLLVGSASLNPNKFCRILSNVTVL
ncbi:triosephosphate isomerase [Thermovirga lienii DSM 17291]|jgi:triosephosphate isomerase|uniref:Triosephosphate isomerase n=1 Tax=Thermovirga lienii (strain ATCC BAA-1197 / DSM 17291 / Cas60314) TaxID=580340 RepID=G7VA30_THELD|nr:triose-phosphate isomerase [Thermovirga lienii]AER66730.1 triosephosphate isomerase [Thermovirga lienii DSM 17291]KUK43110.1 MAG: Triosephosphate isomerase [Thermovirga lienii]MDN5319017.1 triosephosphate isomerase [Thermovirga sp.]HCD70978.1 triose-phosphate isomerase [Thermovirga lienii]